MFIQMPPLFVSSYNKSVQNTWKSHQARPALTLGPLSFVPAAPRAPHPPPAQQDPPWGSATASAWVPQRRVSHCHQFAFLAIKETVRNKAKLLRWPAQIAYLAVNVYAKSLLVLSSKLSVLEPCLAAQ